MISSLAMDDIEDLKAKGLNPTPADIVRLNEIGLRIEAARKKNARTSLDYLPRVARITDELTFRQPTVGHEIWLDRVERIVARDTQTVLAVQCFALSRPPSALPDPDDIASVRTAVAEFAVKFAEVTRDQIFAALDYVICGASPAKDEYPAYAKEDRQPDGYEIDDWKHCVSVGVLNEARAVMLGISVAELEAMTRRQLEDLILRAYIFHKIDVTDNVDGRINDYYMTLAEIRTRLETEKDNG